MNSPTAVTVRHAMLIKRTLFAMKKGNNQKGHMIHACLGHFFRNRYSKITKKELKKKKKIMMLQKTSVSGLTCNIIFFYDCNLLSIFITL